MKLNKTVYNKLLLQAQEAKELGLKKLSNIIFNNIGSVPKEDTEIDSFSSLQLKEKVHSSLWKIALDVIKYHDLESVDIQKIDEILVNLAEQVLSEVEVSLGADDKIGPLEPKLFGEDI